LAVPYRWLGDRSASWWTYCAFVAASLPVVHSLKWGQVSLPLAALIVAGLALREEGYVVLAAALMGVAISIKAYPALVLVPFLLRRDLRFVAQCASFVAAFSVIVPAVVMGPETAWSFARSVRNSAAVSLDEWVWRDLNSQYVAHVVGRLLDDAPTARSALLRALGAGTAVATLLLALLRANQERREASMWAWVLGFACVPFVLQTSWPHYFVFLPLTQAFLARHICVAPMSPIRITAISVLGVSVACSSIVPLLLAGSGQVVSSFGILFFANLAALICVWIAAAALRDVADTGAPSTC
jgi:hypothetical protein